jgi:hypothetical protein
MQAGGGAIPANWSRFSSFILHFSSLSCLAQSQAGDRRKGEFSSENQLARFCMYIAGRCKPPFKELGYEKTTD